MAYAALRAAAIRPGDTVLEPSAGTGMLAVIAECAMGNRAAGSLYLNEYAHTRAHLLTHLFPQAVTTAFNAEAIADRLHDVTPTVVIMNPPFSATPGVDRIRHDADLRHIRSAFSMLPPGGRLVTITSANCIPGDAAWRDTFDSVDGGACTVFTMAIDGRAYARRGTGFDTRLTVLERSAKPEIDIDREARAADAAELLDTVIAKVPPRLPITPETARSDPDRPGAGPVRQAGQPAGHEGQHRRQFRCHACDRPRLGTRRRARRRHRRPRHRYARTGHAGECRPLRTVAAGRRAGAGRDRPSHAAGAVRRHGRGAASRADLPADVLPERVVADGLLSDAQLESVVLAGEAHSRHLAADYRIGAGWETVQRCPEDDGDDDDHGGNDDAIDVTDDGEVLSTPVRFRRGWMLGDGTGAGKGRQVAAIMLDHWLRGRRRALWLSQSDKLVEDARRDWCALGGREDDVIPLGKFRQGAEIPMAEGILFATYATLRSPARQGKTSRLDQIVAWLAGSLDEDDRHAFDGAVIFDEAHAMANAAGSKGNRGEVKPSQQGRAGLRLQNALPDARIAYVSATGATTVPGLAYAGRLGLWAAGETPFETRVEFVTAMEAGGVAAMEVVARDLKALGLYQARALSYDGVEVETLEHPLTPEQRRIYDAYAGAFKIIHRNIEEALKATGIVDGEDTLNRNAKSAALSAFEGAKQRFFGHLLTAMKCPSLIRAIEADLASRRSAVIQLVSTGEALMERRIAEIPASEWDDLSVDLTPRETVIEFLAHAFPVQLQEPFTDESGNLFSRPVFDDDGNPVLCQEAVARRDALIEKLAALPPVPSALDQIVQHFGHEAVAEVTGRSRRVLRISDARGERLALRSRPASANLAETAAFMDGGKRILVFSMAGGTGRSYHADLSCANTERRIHYLLEPGWRADQAIQGLGRTHRTHQASAPLFRPVTTDVKGERRFIATIARRLDSLGAITRGQRDSQTAMGGDGQALFRESDNLESLYAKAALRRFYIALWRGNIPGWSLDRFADATGLKLVHEGNLKEDLPPMPRFLNRLLALPIDEQNQLFAELEERIAANIEQAMEAGAYEVGVETVRADSLAIAGREDALRASRHRGGHRAGRDHPPRQAGALGRRYRVRDRHPRARTRRYTEAGGQRPLEARRRPLAGALAHVRRRRGAGAGSPRPAGQPRDHGPRRARRLQLAPGRRGALAHALGTGDRGAADAPGVALLARRRPAAARLGPAAGREHAGTPARHGYRRGADRARARRRTGRRPCARVLRPRRRSRHDRRGGLRGGDGAGLGARPCQWLAPRPPAHHGRRPGRDRGAGRYRYRAPQAHRLHGRDRVLARPRLRPRGRGPRPRSRTLAARRLSRTRDTYCRPVVRQASAIRIADPPPTGSPFETEHRHDHPDPAGRSELRLLPELRPRRRTAADPHRVRGGRGVCAHGPRSFNGR